MSELIAKFRYFPDDALVPFRQEDLNRIGQRHGATLSIQEIKGKNTRILPVNILVEETHGTPVEEATQTVLTLSAGDTTAFRKAVREIIDTYRGPVPIWGLYGSSPQAEIIANEELDKNDGW